MQVFVNGAHWTGGMAQFYCEPLLFDDDGTLWLQPAPTVERILDMVGISGQQIVLSTDSNRTLLELYDT